MRSLFRHLWLPLYRLWALHHIRSERSFVFEGLHLSVPPGVFHPMVFFSTPIFISFLKKVNLDRKRVLDIGTGSGLLALYAARKGAITTALDISPIAVETARRNAQMNSLSVTIVESDLFDNLPVQLFDIMLINPPYYPHSPRNFPEHAFFAGENLAYFEKLFRQLPMYSFSDDTFDAAGKSAQTYSWMILSEDCDLLRLRSSAAGNGFSLNTVFERKKWGERFWVMEIVPSSRQTV